MKIIAVFSMLLSSAAFAHGIDKGGACSPPTVSPHTTGSVCAERVNYVDQDFWKRKKR